MYTVLNNEDNERSIIEVNPIFDNCQGNVVNGKNSKTELHGTWIVAYTFPTCCHSTLEFTKSDILECEETGTGGKK